PRSLPAARPISRRCRGACGRRRRRRQAGGVVISAALSPEVARPLVLLLALAIDLALGDPPSRYHPVAWLGRLLAAGQRRLCRGSPAFLLVGGAALTLAIAALAGAAGGPGAGVRPCVGFAGGVR